LDLRKILSVRLVGIDEVPMQSAGAILPKPRQSWQPGQGMESDQI
jgi:hypothetical protein